MSNRTFEHAVLDWLEDGSDRTSPAAIDAVLLAVRTTPQERGLRLPRRFITMPTYLRYGAVVAALVIIGVGAFSLVGNGPTIDGKPTPSPSAAVSAPPTTAPTAAPTAAREPTGLLQAGTYTAHPLPTPADSITVTFTVPAGWDAIADPGSGGLGLVLGPNGSPGNQGPGGMAIQFLDVTTLNDDPCKWAKAGGDVPVGPGVDDLIEALGAQTVYEVSEPIDVTIGGFAGRRVEIVSPAALFEGQTGSAPSCDDGAYRYWSTSVNGADAIYVQGPANRWQTNVLDVGGTRLVIVVADFPGTLAADRAEMDAIIASLVIEP